MRIRHKYYPYPVMERVGRSYKEFLFNVTTSVKREGYNIVFEFAAEIADEQISKLIKEGKAVFAYHIQCAQTCYRAAFETSENVAQIVVKEDDLNGLVEVCPFVIAKNDIKAFSSENFSSDYMGIRFDIDKGGILAIGDQSEHTISKDLQDLNNASSIFLVIPNPAANAENMSVEIREKKICVVLPQEQHGIYGSVLHFTLSEFFDGVVVATKLFLDNIIQEEDLSFIVGRSRGATLQELGDKRGLTREGVRQNIEKPLKFIKPIAVCLAKTLIKKMQVKCLTLQDIYDVYDNDDYDAIISYALHESEEIETIDSLGLYFIKDTASVINVLIGGWGRNSKLNV